MTLPSHRPHLIGLLGATLALGLIATPALAGLDRSLSLEVSPGNPEPKVGEPIHFRVRANRAARLYLYATDPSTGMSTLLMPNRRQTDNRLPAGATLVVPGPEIRYLAATPGVLKITAVASTRPLEVVGAKSAGGDLPTLPSKEMEAGFSSKGVVPESGHVLIGRDELAVSRFDLKVGPADPPPSAASDADPAGETDAVSEGVAFISSNTDRVRLGETLRVVFGADRQGWVHLLVVEPGGTRQMLISREVDGETIQSAETVAEAPTGEHALIAVYTPGPELDPSRLDQHLSKYRDKGLRLLADLPPGAIAVKHIAIEP